MSRRLVIYVAVFIGVLASAARAGAAPIQAGDAFNIVFTDTALSAIAYLDTDPSQQQIINNPDFGAVTSGTFVLGNAVSPGFFRIAEVIDLVGSPSYLTVDLSSIFFDAATWGLTGTITTTFLGGSGGNHTDVLTASDTVAQGVPGKWVLADDHVTGGFTIVTSGTYTATRVPEPSTIVMLGPGVAVFAVLRRRKKHTSAQAASPAVR